MAIGWYSRQKRNVKGKINIAGGRPKRDDSSIEYSNIVLVLKIREITQISDQLRDHHIPSDHTNISCLISTSAISSALCASILWMSCNWRDADELLIADPRRLLWWAPLGNTNISKLKEIKYHQNTKSHINNILININQYHQLLIIH